MIITITAATTATTIITILLIIRRRLRIFRIIIIIRRRRRNKILHDRSKLTQICAKLIFKRFASFPLNGNLLF